MADLTIGFSQRVSRQRQRDPHFVRTTVAVLMAGFALGFLVGGYAAKPKPGTIEVTRLPAASSNQALGSNGASVMITSGTTAVPFVMPDPRDAGIERLFTAGREFSVMGPNGTLVSCYMPNYPLTAENDTAIRDYAGRHHMPIVAVGDQYCVDP